MATSDDFFFGVELAMDASGFLEGTKQALNAFEALVAGMTHSNGQAQGSIKAFNQSLSATHGQATHALRQMGRDREAELRLQGKAADDAAKREAQRQKQHLLTLRQNAAEERRIINSRRHSVASLRDTWFSLAAAAAGGASLSALGKIVINAVHGGVPVSKQADGAMPKPDTYKQGLKVNFKASKKGSFLKKTQRAEANMAKGLTHPHKLEGPPAQTRPIMASRSIVNNSGLDSDIRALQSKLGNVRYMLAYDIEPTVTALADMVEKVTEFAQKHPNARQKIVETTAVAVKALAVITTIGDMFVPINAALKLAQSSIALAAVVNKQAQAVQTAGLLGTLSPAGTPTGPTGAAILAQLAQSLGKHDGTADSVAKARADGTAPDWLKGTPTPKGFGNELSKVGGATWEPVKKGLSSIGGSEAHAATLQPKLLHDVGLQLGGSGIGFKKISKQEAESNKEEMAAILKSKGWSDAQISGLLARASLESGYNQHAIGDSGLAHGIMQWHPDREMYFRKLFGHGLLSATPREQAEFIDWELNNSERSAGNRLRKADTADEAGDIVSRYFIRPKAKDLEAAKTSNLASSLYKQTQQSLRLMAQQNAQLPVIGAHALSRSTTASNVSDNSTEINIQNLTVQANNPRQLTNSLSALKANSLALNSNSGLQ